MSSKNPTLFVFAVEPFTHKQTANRGGRGRAGGAGREGQGREGKGEQAAWRKKTGRAEGFGEGYEAAGDVTSATTAIARLVSESSPLPPLRKKRRRSAGVSAPVRGQDGAATAAAASIGAAAGGGFHGGGGGGWDIATAGVGEAASGGEEDLTAGFVTMDDSAGMPQLAKVEQPARHWQASDDDSDDELTAGGVQLE